MNLGAAGGGHEIVLGVIVSVWWFLSVGLKVGGDFKGRNGAIPSRFKFINTTIGTPKATKLDCLSLLLLFSRQGGVFFGAFSSKNV